jgi:hypothetical protein
MKIINQKGNIITKAVKIIVRREEKESPAQSNLN